ncbi:hypothetical protein BVC80_1707g151 [Macleaya cordata]|uniref:Uncharacterized protein n=1 Tax=Macleaya cordata TaxID=56857 RepID=A0A200Q6C2_MACCD|nr:hypothetical protein BVC80_1707g151 [Macleaya cordata]
MMGVFLILILSYNFHLISALSSSASPLHKPVLSSSSSSSADVQENNVNREMTNEKLLAGEGNNVVSINRRGFGGGRSSSASHGSGGGAGGRGGYVGAGRSYNGGGGQKGTGGGSKTPYGPGALGVIPLYAAGAGAGAANNHRSNQHHRNAAASPNHSQIGFISLRTGLILSLLLLSSF